VKASGYYQANLERLTKVIPIYIGVAAFYLVIFTPLIVLEVKNAALIIVHILDVGVVIWSYLYFRYTRDVVKTSFALSLIAYLTVVSVMATNGVAQSGMFLAFPYVPFIAFMRDPNSARRWMMGMLLTMLALLFASLFGITRLPISKNGFGLYIVNYVIILVIIFGDISEKERSDKRFSEQLKNSDKLNRELEETLSERSRVVKKLEQQREQLEKINTVMVDRELKMVELKQELAEKRQKP